MITKWSWGTPNPPITLPWPSHLTDLLSLNYFLLKEKCKSMGGYGRVFNLLGIKTQFQVCFKCVFFFRPTREPTTKKNWHTWNTLFSDPKGSQLKKPSHPSHKKCQKWAKCSLKCILRPPFEVLWEGFWVMGGFMGGLGEPEDHFLIFHGRLFKFQNLIIIITVW